ncbi:MAG: endopeptidase La [Ruminococcus sp.]|jgi:ATP-dependent Lon protease|nr:endopeptidase La [Ruminococcus sp.]
MLIEKEIPMVTLYNFAIFPNMSISFSENNKANIKAFEMAFENEREVFVNLEIKENVVNKTGVVAKISQFIKMDDKTYKIFIEGVRTADHTETLEKDECTVVKISYDDEPEVETDKAKLIAAMRILKRTFEFFALFLPGINNEVVAGIKNEKDPQHLYEEIAFHVDFDLSAAQELIECKTLSERLEKLSEYLLNEADILRTQTEIQAKVMSKIDKEQREYVLRNQLEVINEELGRSSSNQGQRHFPIDDDDWNDEGREYASKIVKLPIKQEYKDKLMKDVKNLSRYNGYGSDYATLCQYLDTVVELPWDKYTKDEINIDKAEKVLARDHYGLKKIKERIIETLSVQILTKSTGNVLCLVGPPGTGKTSIGKSLAEAMGREFVRVSLGGVNDEADIRGHRKTYVASMPGRIVNAVKQAKSLNPIIMLDEVDKLANSRRGDPSSALLELFDTEQNSEFRDHYLEIPIDLSRVMFIATANDMSEIPTPLLDRMDIIELSSYTRDEKYHIAKEHLLKKQIKKNGLKGTQIRIDDTAIYSLIDDYTREAGVRNLEREISRLCRKTATNIVSEKAKRTVFDKDNLESYIGPPKFTDDFYSKKPEVGFVNGLAWTSVGGCVLPLETLVLKGKGSVQLTGKLGDVMQESAKIAVSYVRSVAEEYNINGDFYRKNDLHINAPEGAVPKDGPSAGVTLVTAIVSALSGIPVKSNVAMTGEITLLGKVLKIGGLREKTMAAYKAGIDTVIIPETNKSDLFEVEEIVKENVKFIFAENIKDVLDEALLIDKNSVNSNNKETAAEKTNLNPKPSTKIKEIPTAKTNTSPKKKKNKTNE